MLNSLLVCERKGQVTTRDALFGAGVMVGASLLFMMLGIGARRLGSPVIADALADRSFFGALTLSMPFWLMKGQPRTVQTVVVGVTLLSLVALSYLASAN